MSKLETRTVTEFATSLKPDQKLRKPPVFKRLSDLLFSLFQDAAAFEALRIATDKRFVRQPTALARWGNDTGGFIRLFDRRNSKEPLVQVVADPKSSDSHGIRLDVGYFPYQKKAIQGPVDRKIFTHCKTHHICTL